MSKIFKKIHEYTTIAKTLRRGGFLASLMLIFALLSVPLRKKIFGRKPRKLKLSYQGNKFDFFARDAADIAVLKEVFVDGEYDINHTTSPAHKFSDLKNIIDIGSHVGASVIFFCLKFPDAKITAYEPDQDNFKMLVRNTAAFTQVSCVNAAISSKSGTTILNSREGSSISGTIVDRDVSLTTSSSSGQPVKTVALEEILNSHIDLLKFDVEGAEFDIFSNTKKLSSIKSLIGELHLDLIPGKTKEDFCSIFKGFEIQERRLRDDRYILSMKQIAK